jgi:hypothetical protein
MRLGGFWRGGSEKNEVEEAKEVREVKGDERSAPQTGLESKPLWLRAFTRKRRRFRMTNGWMGCDRESGGKPPHSKLRAMNCGSL